MEARPVLCEVMWINFSLQTRVRSLAGTIEFYGGQSGTGAGFSPNTLVYSLFIPPMRHIHLNMYINQQDAQTSMIELYFSLDALHVSDYISPSSGATL